MLYDRVLRLVALITSRPQGTMGLFFIFQTFTKNGMRRGTGSSKVMLTDYQKPTQETLLQSVYFLQAEPAGNLSHSHPLRQGSSSDMLSLTAFHHGFSALAPRSPRALVVLLPIECPITDILYFPVIARSRTQFLRSYLCITSS